MPFRTIAERKIRDAMAEGAFDNLRGQGKRIDLEEYFQTPEHLRMALSVLKSANCVPEEVALLNQVASLERRLADAPENSRPTLRATLAAVRLKLDLAMEHRRR